MKCPICGNELKKIEKKPEFGYCSNCKKAFKWQDNSSAGIKSSNKKKGGGTFIIALVSMILLLAAIITAVIFISKYKEDQEPVELTVPAEFIEGSTQEDLDKLAKEYGINSIVLNPDGSATYTMTKKQHKEFMKDYRDQLNQTINEMIGSEEYPNFTNIEANDNFTEFTVTTKSTELDIVESFSVMAFYMYGGLYNIFSEEDIDDVSVTFVNADSGQVIETANSSDLE